MGWRESQEALVREAIACSGVSDGSGNLREVAEGVLEDEIRAGRTPDATAMGREIARIWREAGEDHRAES